MTDLSGVSIGVAALAGLLSFLSPCVLPLMPVYLTVISGASVAELEAGDEAGLRRRVMFNASAFVCGFAAIFVTLGATATFAGRLLDALRFELFGLPIGLAQLGGVFVIVMGLHIAGWLRIPALYRVWNVDVAARRVGIAGAFLVGAGFAFGWSPCIGPILGSILTLAASRDTVMAGVSLLAVYSVGLAIPFLLSAWSVGALMRVTRRIRSHGHVLEIGSGLLLIAIGVLMITGDWSVVNQAAAQSFSWLDDWILQAEEHLVR